MNNLFRFRHALGALATLISLALPLRGQTLINVDFGVGAVTRLTMSGGSSCKGKSGVSIF
jgi:hypothetical protein